MTDFTIAKIGFRADTPPIEVWVHFGPARVRARLDPMTGRVRLDDISDPDLRLEIAKQVRAAALVEFGARLAAMDREEAKQRVDGLAMQEYCDQINAAFAKQEAEDAAKREAAEAAPAPRRG